ncbi:putative chemoreceptor glutamine deamidase CheD [Syntrophobacter sp. SbD1]|nr:putative chemoreceptor glutamine deamidase CheD [Syntrophobacter sp. SbD1]
MKKIFSIHIGGFHASREPAVIGTLLGPCVAVCLYDPVARIGGMNHILLPGKADLKIFDNVARYAINAMELLINKIMTLGGQRSNLVSKVFGGANVLPAVFAESGGIGARNSEFVLEFLQMEAISIVSQDLGGHDTRKIYFHTDSGEVLLKRTRPSWWRNIGFEERRLLESARRKVEECGEAALFV